MEKIMLENGEEIIYKVNGDIWHGDFGTEGDLKKGVDSSDVISIFTLRKKIFRDYKQISGTFIFTNKRIYFQATLSKEYQINIYYHDIKKIEPFKVMFFNTGLFIICKDNIYPISVLKRDRYINLINNNGRI